MKNKCGAVVENCEKKSHQSYNYNVLQQTSVCWKGSARCTMVVVAVLAAANQITQVDADNNDDVK